MDESRARDVAAAIGGDAEVWQSGGGIWLVVIVRDDGRMVVISDECVCEYATWGDFDAARPSTSIYL